MIEKVFKYTVIITAITMLVIGCSDNKTAVIPVFGDEGDINSTEYTSDSEIRYTQTHLWGLWDIYFDPGALQFEITQNRNAMYTANVVLFLNKNPMGLLFDINSTPVYPDYIGVDIDVTLTHPFDEMPSYNGYDVRGVFMANASQALDYDPAMRYGVPGLDQFMENPDGYTRWFNPSEFYVSGVLGYTHGKLATPDYTSNATLCPYKYYADGLEVDDDLWDWLADNQINHGVFSSGASNTRNYLLQFPNSTGVKYSYAVLANWEGEDLVTDHPANTTEAVAVRIQQDPSAMYYASPSSFGGNLAFEFSMFDWSYQVTAGQPENINLIVESSVLSDPYVVPLSEVHLIDWNFSTIKTYSVEIPVDIVHSSGDWMWLMLEYADYNYGNDYGWPNSASNEPLTAYFLSSVECSECPDPYVTGIVPDFPETGKIVPVVVNGHGFDTDGVTVWLEGSLGNVNGTGVSELTPISFTAIFDMTGVPEDTFAVRVANNCSSENGDEFTFHFDPCILEDTEDPVTNESIGCPGTQPSGTTNVVFTDVTATDNCTPAQFMMFQFQKIKKAGSVWPDWPAEWGPGYVTYDTYELEVNGLDQGDWRVRIRARDEAGNVDTTPVMCEFHINSCQEDDEENPTLEITAGCYDYSEPTSSVDFSVDGHDNCTDDGDEEGQPDNLLYSWRTTGDWSDPESGPDITVNGGLVIGENTVEFKAIDEASNETYPYATCVFWINDCVATDDTDPVTTIISGCHDYPLGVTNVQFTVDGSDNCTPTVNLLYQWRAFNEGSQIYGWSTPSLNTTISFNTNGLEGHWMFQVRAIDEAGNFVDNPDIYSDMFTTCEFCVVHEGQTCGCEYDEDPEPNDTYETATQVISGCMANGFLSDEIDMWKFTLADPGLVEFYMYFKDLMGGGQISYSLSGDDTGPVEGGSGFGLTGPVDKDWWLEPDSYTLMIIATDGSFFDYRFLAIGNFSDDPCNNDITPPVTDPDGLIVCPSSPQPVGTTEVTIQNVFGEDNCTYVTDIRFQYRKKLSSVTDWTGIPWSSPPEFGPNITIDGLSAGEWDFQLRAVDAEGNVETYAQDSDYTGCLNIVINGDPCLEDNDPPETYLGAGSCPGDQAIGTRGVVITDVTGTDPNDCTPEDEIRFQWRKIKNSGEWVSEWSYPILGPRIWIDHLYGASWEVEIRAYDNAGNFDPTPVSCGPFDIPELTPSSPSHCQSITLPQNQWEGVTAYGNYTYSHCGGYHIQILYSANGCSSYIYNDTAIGGGMYIEYRDGYLYCTDVRIVDVTDPDNPFITATNYGTSSTFSTIKDNYMFTANGRIINLDDVYNPFDEGTWAIPSGVGSLTTMGNYLFLGRGLGNLSGEISIYDISDPLAPSYISSVALGGQDIRDMQAQENYLYFLNHDANYDNTLKIMDISDINTPSIVNQVGLGNSQYQEGERIDVCGNYVYISADESGLQIVNVTNPLTAGLSYTINAPKGIYAHEIAVCGKYAYMISRPGFGYWGGLEIYRIRP